MTTTKTPDEIKAESPEVEPADADRLAPVPDADVSIIQPHTTPEEVAAC